jgi:hypothetical protein
VGAGPAVEIGANPNPHARQPSASQAISQRHLPSVGLTARGDEGETRNGNQ